MCNKSVPIVGLDNFDFVKQFNGLIWTIIINGIELNIIC